MTKEIESGFYRHKLDPQMRWFPRPNEKCSGDFYTEKVKLLVNWFRFSSKVDDREYCEYGVQMVKIKNVKTKTGQVKQKETVIAVLNRPALFWKHLRYEKEKMCRNNHGFNIEEYVFDNKDTVYSINRHDDPIVSEMEFPEEKGVKYILCLTLRSVFRLNFSRENPLRDEEADRSYKFLKTVMAQKVCYSPAENEKIAIEFAKNFVYTDNVIHRIPDSFYTPETFDYKLEIAPRIESWFGVYIGVRETFEGEPVLNFGIMDKLFYNAPSMSLLDYLLLVVDPSTREDEVRNERKRTLRDQQSTIEKSMCSRVDKYMANMKLKCAEVWDEKGCRMTERHLTYVKLHDLNANQYIIQEPAGKRRNAPTRPVSLFKIYEMNQKYIDFPSLPLVLAKSGANEYVVPMELLQVHEKPQRYKSWIDHAMKDKFVARATRKPHIYKEEIINALKDLQFDLNDLNFINSFGLSPSLKMIECPGKVLNEPNLVNKENEKIKMTPIIRGFQEKQLNVVPDQELCCAVFIMGRNNKPCLPESEAVSFYEELVDGFAFRGMRIGENSVKKERSLLSAIDTNGEKKYGFYSNCSLFDGVSRFEAAADHAIHLFNKNPDKEKKILLFIIISERSQKAYGYLKYICDTKLGVASQHIARDTVSKALAAAAISSHRIAYQVALKVNAKLNGVNQELEWSENGEMTVSEKEKRKKAPLKMYVGIDVTHPTNNSGIDFSIASIVASINPGGTRYKTMLITQEDCKPGLRPVAHGRERTDILEGKFIELLKEFAKHNNNKVPAHIIVYRDGVGDSEMLRISHNELRSLKREVDKFISERGGSEQPKYTFIVLQKRHKTRFFRQIDEKRPNEKVDEIGAKRWDEDMKSSNNTGIVNPSSGTTVDKKVISKYKFDFFLSSHHGALGTSRPGHYTVMYDDAGLTKDEIYKMSYELAFLSVRCRKPISLPAPVHYAHLSCEKAKEVYRAYKEHLSSEHPATFNRFKFEKDFLQPHTQYPGMPFA